MFDVWCQILERCCPEGMTSDIRKVHDVQKANCPDIGAVPHPDMPGGLLAPSVPVVSEH